MFTDIKRDMEVFPQKSLWFEGKKKEMAKVDRHWSNRGSEGEWIRCQNPTLWYHLVRQQRFRRHDRRSGARCSIHWCQWISTLPCHEAEDVSPRYPGFGSWAMAFGSSMTRSFLWRFSSFALSCIYKAGRSVHVVDGNPPEWDNRNSPFFLPFSHETLLAPHNWVIRKQQVVSG